MGAAVTASDWDLLVERVGAPDSRPSNDVEGLRRVRRVVRRLSGLTPDADIALALLTAASRGGVRDNLSAVQTWSRREKAALNARARRGNAAPEPSSGILLIAVLSVVAMAVGPALAYRSVKTSSEFIINDISAAALSSGIVMALTAAWFLASELIPSARIGGRPGTWVWPVYVLAIVFSVAAIVTVSYRFSAHGSSGTAIVGSWLQVVALALYIVALIVALRNRGTNERHTDEAAKASRRRIVDELDADLRRRTARALANAGLDELDRMAAQQGLRELYDQARLPADRAEKVLRDLNS